MLKFFHICQEDFSSIAPFTWGIIYFHYMKKYIIGICHVCFNLTLYLETFQVSVD